MLAILDQRYQDGKEAEKLYEENNISLHLLGSILGVQELTLVRHLAANPNVRIKCVDDAIGRMDRAVDDLATSTELVLDISAIATLSMLQSELLVESWPGKIFISQSTAQVVRDCLKEAKTSTRSRRSIGKSEAGYYLVENDEELLKQDLFLVDFLAMLLQRCEVLGCLELVHWDPNKRKSYNAAFGQHTLESIVIASRLDCILWTDDQMVALLARSEFNVKSVWTQSIVEFGAIRGFSSLDCARVASAKLLANGYVSTIVDSSTFGRAAMLSDWNPIVWPFNQVLAVFGDKSYDDGYIHNFAFALIYNLYRMVTDQQKHKYVIDSLAKQILSRPSGRKLLKGVEENLHMSVFFNLFFYREFAALVKPWIDSQFSTGQNLNGSMSVDTSLGEKAVSLEVKQQPRPLTRRARRRTK